MSPLSPETAPEASGLAVSTGSPERFFTIDDSTGTAAVTVVDAAGQQTGSVTVEELSAGNAEALASGPCGDAGETCLYIGDIGDHIDRDHITITRIAEPSASPADVSAAGDAWDYRYPDGPQDAEALIVDAAGRPIIITKADSKTEEPHRIYRGEPGGGELTLIGPFDFPEPETPLQSMLTGNVVTDAFYSGGRLLLLGYDQIIEYQAPSPKADPATFPAWERHALPMPPLAQAEGITGLPDGCGYAVISEAGPAGERAHLAVQHCS